MKFDCHHNKLNRQRITKMFIIKVYLVFFPFSWIYICIWLVVYTWVMQFLSCLLLRCWSVEETLKINWTPSVLLSKCWFCERIPSNTLMFTCLYIDIDHMDVAHSLHHVGITAKPLGLDIMFLFLEMTWDSEGAVFLFVIVPRRQHIAWFGIILHMKITGIYIFVHFPVNPNI